jgi:hypothetical protein
MSDLYDKIISQRGGFENLVAKIPGFRGYLDNKARRAADRLVRDHIADEYSARIDRFSDIEKTVLDGGGLASMSKTAAVKANLQHFRDLVKTAAPGYSGAFEQIKIMPDDLEKIYSFDEAMIRYVDQLDAALNTLDTAAASKTGIDEALAGVDKVTAEAEQAFSLRDDVLTQLSKGV